ncbi:hypothetical protein Tco_1365977, partial [Tanacetum coccineum]
MSLKANDWLALTKGMAHIHQRNTPNEGICTKISAKEAQSLPNDWIATLAIRVLYSHPTANDQDLMIRRNEGLRSSGACMSLEPSLLAYKRSLILTH